MAADRSQADHIRHVLEHAVETLATGTDRIHQCLADAYHYSHLGDDADISQTLPPTVHALQLDLREAMTENADGPAPAQRHSPMTSASSSPGGSLTRPA